MPEKNLAFGRKYSLDGLAIPGYTVYSTKGVYWCGRPEENLDSEVFLEAPREESKQGELAFADG